MLATLTFIHVALSLIGLASGFVVIHALLESRLPEGWTRVFLVTTVLTSVTGFFFPVRELLPSHIVGILSSIVLAVSLAALYGRRLAGGWGRTFAVTAVAAQYLNFFVFVVQLFLKVPALNALAPTQTEPAFGAAQGLALVVFAWLAFRVGRKPPAPSLGAAARA